MLSLIGCQRNKEIFEAAGNGSPQDVKDHIEEKGADINVKNDIGLMPLQYVAFSNPNVDVLKYRLSQEVDINAIGESDGTLLHFAAIENPNTEILECSIAHGVGVNLQESRGRTPLDLAKTEEKKTILREADGKSGKEL